MSSKGSSKLRLRIIRTIDENSLLDGVKSVLLGFSGGADSAVLFDVLLSLRKKYSFTLYAAHVNHMIRGAESDRDEELVRLVCQKAGVKLFVKRIDVPAIAAENSQSLELAARDARYRFFNECVEENGIDVIATAHNACDNTETLLLNLVRGTSVKGLAGIPYKRKKIIRPLRDCTRDMITEYALRYGVTYVTDSTNLIDDCSRNIIRLKVIPELRRINPSLDTVVLAESKSFSELSSLIDGVQTDRRSNYADMPDYLIRAAVIKECGIVDRELLSRIADALRSRKNLSFTLADGKTLKVSDGEFKLSAADKEVVGKIEYTALLPGKNELDCGSTVFLAYPESFNEIYNYTTTLRLSFDNINSVVSVRSRSEGDRISVRGMTKSVKKEFINKKIPREYRDLIPVICVDGAIAAIPFIGVDDSFYVKNQADASVCLGIDFPFETKSFS